MLRRAVVSSIVAAAMGFSIMSTGVNAGCGQNYVGGLYYPYNLNQGASGLPPFLLAPGFYPAVWGCWQSRVVRTPFGWQRQPIWVCS